MTTSAEVVRRYLEIFGGGTLSQLDSVVASERLRSAATALARCVS